VLNRALINSKRLLGQKDTLHALFERSDDEPCDLLLFFMVLAGAGARGDPPDISPRHWVDDNAKQSIFSGH
jgi:hypothetical protein